jgi:hypothetical protein
MRPSLLKSSGCAMLVGMADRLVIPPGSSFWDSEDAPLVGIPGKPGFFSAFGGKELRPLGPGRPGDMPDRITEEEFWVLVERSKKSQ